MQTRIKVHFSQKTALLCYSWSDLPAHSHLFLPEISPFIIYALFSDLSVVLVHGFMEKTLYEKPFFFAIIRQIFQPDILASTQQLKKCFPGHALFTQA